MRRARGLEYEVRGHGEAVLFIHGSHFAGAFLPLMDQPALADHFRLIRYHRRGFAGSEPLPGPPGVGHHVQDALGLIEQLGVDRLHVVAHSAGGLIATQLALDEPSLVHSLVLLEPALMTRDEASSFATLMAPLFELHANGKSEMAADLFLSGGGETDWRAEVRVTVPGGEDQAMQDAAFFFESDLPMVIDRTFDPEDGERLAQPVLHVRGGASPLDYTTAIRMLAPQAESVVLSDVGHGMQMVVPEKVAGMTADFLDRHPFAGGG